MEQTVFSVVAVAGVHGFAKGIDQLAGFQRMFRTSQPIEVHADRTGRRTLECAAVTQHAVFCNLGGTREVAFDGGVICAMFWAIAIARSRHHGFVIMQNVKGGARCLSD